MGVQKYSAETREQCIKLRNDGLTFVEIAARLNIPYWKSVARIFYTNGETSGRLMSDDEKQTIVNLYKSGYSVQEISAETRRSATGIRKHLIESGLIIICGKSQRESRYDEMREYTDECLHGEYQHDTKPRKRLELKSKRKTSTM